MVWRQTLYTFLLRRVLGPYLSSESLQQLYNSIEVSLQEGTFSLNDVELNAAYLTSQQSKVSIHHVRIRKLQIRLSLREKEETPSSSVTWRAMNLGREGAGVSLQAHLEVDGVEIHLGPPSGSASEGNVHEPPTRNAEETTTSSTASSMIGSYVDAALASLRLSLDMKNIKIRMVGSEEQWVDLDLTYARYHDRQSQDAAMHKAIDFSGISVQTCIENRKELVAKLDGGGQMSLRAKNVGGEGKLQQDVSVSLYQRVNLSVGEYSLRCILGVVDAFSSQPDSPTPSRNASLAASENFEMPSDVELKPYSEAFEHDEEDVQTMKGILQQYAEARQFAERNEIRGGILVPDDDTMSFDAFFDANELSFSTYRSTLEGSILSKTAAACDDDDYVHTHFKLHLGECRIKIAFPNRDVDLPTEYLLFTFGDFNLSSSICSRSSEVDASVGRMEAETSQVSTAGRPEIETLLCFEHDEDPNNLVSATSCIEVHVRSQGGSKEFIDVRLQTLKLFYNRTTMENFASLMTSVRPIAPVGGAPSDTMGSPQQITTVSVWISAITLLIPVNGVPDSTFSTLFERCGYMIEEDSPSKSASVGISLEDVALTTLSSATGGIGDSVTGRKVSCLRAAVFVSAPVTRGSSFTHRMDVLALAGQIPLSVKHSRSSPYASSATEGEAVFPKVPAMSSFKAREDDDDMDDSDRYEIMDSLRSPDPQPTLLEAASQCHEAIEVHIPDLTLDLAKAEVVSLTKIIRGCMAGPSSDISGGASDAPNRLEPKSKLLAVAVNVDQVTACAHCDRDSFSFKVIGRDWKVFTAFQGPKVSCLRAMTHEIDLYTAQQLIYREDSASKNGAISIRDRCDAIRQRTVRNASTKSVPIMYRSQLFPPLSPKSPALLLDLINGSDEQCSEWTVHFSVYNMTHRCDVESTWYTYARDFLESDDEGEIVKGSALTKIFVTVADCNVDYTSSKDFHQASRTILRVSDIRLSSNVISPPQPVQAFRLSVGDVALLIGNKRHSYNSENACLSRSVTILGPEDLDVVNSNTAAPDLQQMNLVTMLTLDSFVASVTLASASKQSCMRNHGVNDPNISANLTFGSLCFYGCKDSFECLMETVSDLSLKLAGLTGDQVEALKQKDLLHEKSRDEGEYDCSGDQRFFDSSISDPDESVTATDKVPTRNTISPPVSNADHELDSGSSESFELDGYDWTAIDHKWSKDKLPAGEEQVARWFSAGSDDTGSQPPDIRSTIGSEPRPGTLKLPLITHHIQLKPSLNPLVEGDMDAAHHAGTTSAPPVNVRTVIRDLKVRCRFFDGYDWPQDVKKSEHPATRKYAFIIDHTLDGKGSDIDQKEEPKPVQQAQSSLARKKELMGALLEQTPTGTASAFRDMPLPEERGAMLMDKAEQRRLARRINCFFQISLSGIKLRMDSFEQSQSHRLASCMDLRIEDLFIAETISNPQPTKMVGEWLNDVEHPRDTKHGLVMMRMVTWHPKKKVTDENKIANDESEAVLQLLPLRCYIDQRALRFARAFFTNGEETKEKRWAFHLTQIPPPLFLSFRIKPCKLKVNYTPEKVDVAALRDGSIVELINVSPLNDMVIMLQAVDVEDKVGFGEVISHFTASWIRDIVSTQLHKFVANSSAFQPFTSISTGAVDMVVLPWDAVKNGDSITQALRKGARQFAGSVVYETLNVSAKLTNKAARMLFEATSPFPQRSTTSALPSRPQGLPRNVLETTDHACDSLAKGFETANYKIIIIPYREYRRSGATGAAISVVKGIPVAILAPIGAASEALSYALLGARNQVRPDIRKEEEASQKGLIRDF